MKIEVVSEREMECIRRLRDSLNAYHTATSPRFKNHFSKYTFEKWMKRMNKRDRFIAYVAQDNDENVGYCVATVDGLIGEIASLFVSELYRRKGVGKELMSLALKWLEGQKCEAIRVSIAVGNENVLDFYRKFNFTEKIMVMQRTHNECTDPVKRGCIPADNFLSINY